MFTNGSQFDLFVLLNLGLTSDVSKLDIRVKDLYYNNSLLQ